MTPHLKRMTPAAARVRLDQLPHMLKAERDRRGLSMRDAAAEMLLSPSTMTRVEAGDYWPDLAGFLAIAAWLRLPMDWFVDGEDAPMDAYRRGWDDCAATIRAVLDDNPRTEES
jgi:transcriptional regulator with XRE-family HTH domain